MSEKSPESTELSDWELTAKDSTFEWEKEEHSLVAKYENKNVKIIIYQNDSKYQTYDIKTDKKLTVESIRRLSQQKLAETFNSW